MVLTRTTNTGVGPCVNRRAAMLNRAHADVAIDIHADGGPPSGRGFSILEPVADGPNDKVIGSSAQFGSDVMAEMLRHTPMPVSDYDGIDGLQRLLSGEGRDAGVLLDATRERHALQACGCGERA